MSAVTVRADVDRVKRRGHPFDARQDALLARMSAVVTAQNTLVAREAGAGFGLRQALVERAASAELVAAELPEPAPDHVRRSAGWNIGT